MPLINLVVVQKKFTVLHKHFSLFHIGGSGGLVNHQTVSVMLDTWAAVSGFRDEMWKKSRRNSSLKPVMQQIATRLKF